MKLLFAMSLAGFAATSALAGEKSVDFPVFYLGDISVFYVMMSSTTSTPLAVGLPEIASAGAAAAPVATTTVPRGVTNQFSNNALGTQEVVYANLLKEAKKRGLR